ncbi:MAG: tetratricopeptide repeat protein [bacterium]
MTAWVPSNSWRISRLICGSTLIFAFSLYAQEFPQWGNLKPGPYHVGFKVESTFDHARTFNTPKYNYEGEFQKGERARPMVIAIWYPAQKTGKAQAASFEEYFYPPVAGKISEQQKIAARQGFKNSPLARDMSQEKVDQLLGTRIAAARNATAEKGAFPVIVLAQGFNLQSNTHSVMCEYLASQGYVVATSPSRGAAGNQMTFDLVGVETQARDMEFIIAFLRDFPNVDQDKLGVAGFSFGGLPAATLAMRNTDVDAVLSLDSAIGDNGGYSLLFRTANFNPANVRAAFMLMAADTPAPNTPNLDLNFYKAIKFADKYLLRLKDQRHFDFTTVGAISSQFPEYAPFAGPKQGDSKLGHETVCQYALSFFNAYVKRDPIALGWLQKKPEDHGLPAGFATAEVQSGSKAPPTENDLTNMITAGGITEVADLHRKYKEIDADFDLFQENMMNNLGYTLLGQQRVEDAIDVFKLNIEAYPDSWNTYDSLGEAYAAQGETQKAIELYSKALEMNPGDQRIEQILADFKQKK